MFFCLIVINFLHLIICSSLSVDYVLKKNLRGVVNTVPYNQKIFACSVSVRC